MKDRVIWLGNIFPTSTRDNPNQGRVYDVNGVCPTITNISGENLQPMIVVESIENMGKTFKKLTVKKQILGGIYTNQSTDFQHGILPKVSRCLKSEKIDAGVVEKLTFTEIKE